MNNYETDVLIKIMEERDDYRREAARMTDLWRKQYEKNASVAGVLGQERDHLRELLALAQAKIALLEARIDILTQAR